MSSSPSTPSTFPSTIARKSVARKSTPTGPKSTPNVPKKISPKPKPSNSAHAIAPTMSSPQSGQFPAPAQAMYTPAISALPPQYQIYQANGQTFLVPISSVGTFSMTPNQTPLLSLGNGGPSGGRTWTQPASQQPQLGPIFMQNATFPMQAQSLSQPETASTTLSQPHGTSLSSVSKNEDPTIITISPDSSPPTAQTPKPETPTNSGIQAVTPSHKSVGTGISRKVVRKRASQKVETTPKEEKEIAKPEVTSSLSAPSEWTVDQVYQFILSLSGCSEIANQFLEQEIDGQGLVLLKVDQLIKLLNIKLGPALKIVGNIAQLSKQAANSEA